MRGGKGGGERAGSAITKMNFLAHPRRAILRERSCVPGGRLRRGGGASARNADFSAPVAAHSNAGRLRRSARTSAYSLNVPALMSKADVIH